MKTPLWLATERARAFVRNRGWRMEPLTWEEVGELLEAQDEINEDYFHIDDVIERISRVPMSKAARKALAENFGVDPEDLAPRIAS